MHWHRDLQQIAATNISLAIVEVTLHIEIEGIAEDCTCQCLSAGQKLAESGMHSERCHCTPIGNGNAEALSPQIIDLEGEEARFVQQYMHCNSESNKREFKFANKIWAFQVCDSIILSRSTH